MTRGAPEQLLAPCLVAMGCSVLGQLSPSNGIAAIPGVTQSCCLPRSLCQPWPAASHWLSCCLPCLLTSHTALSCQVEASDSRKHLTGSAVDSANVDLEAGMATIQAQAEDSIKAGAR